MAQLYLGDPAAAHEPPRQLVGFDKVSLPPGRSARLHFTITPQDTWWWKQTAGGWTQSLGRYQVYVGDSSALSNLPLRGAYAIKESPAARQVTVHAPGAFRVGRTSRVTVRLTRSGNETLRTVTLALQLPQGWTATPVGPATFHNVSPSRAVSTTFRVTPPSYSPRENVTVHATASLGPDAQREAGVQVPVR